MGDRSSPDVVVGPRCHIQRPAKRFGAHAPKEIREYVLAPPPSLSPPPVDEFEDVIFEMGDDASQSGDDELITTTFATVAATITGAAAAVADAAGAGAALPLSNNLAPGQEDGAHDGIDPSTGHPRIPRVARTRSNLTALSQRYNLYFAAYQNKIYVYQPQRAPQILPPVSLVLRPPESEMARLTGGFQDRRFPHQMNHIVVGDLGNLEILLLSFDDGDVVAYYTHLIVQAIEQRRSLRGRKAGRLLPGPFFHENVGASAWGLAIHTHSRLVAASSNRHDVTVFAFALESKEKQTDEQAQASPELWSGQGVLGLEMHFRSRTRTWRIVLSTGHDGRNSPHNIPSIAFCDDDRGNADKVAAVDINGNTWLLDIWNVGGHAAATLIKQTSKVGAPNFQDPGWSVLVLPNSSFKPAMSNHAAMGLAATQIVGLNTSMGDGIKNYIWLDITASLCRVPDMAADPNVFLRQRHGSRYHSGGAPSGWHFVSIPIMGFIGESPVGYEVPLVDDMSIYPDDDEEEGEASPALSPPPELPPLGVRADIKTDTFDPGQERKLGYELGLTIVPGMAKVCQTSTAERLRDFVKASAVREQATNVVGQQMRRDRLLSYLAENFSIMKTTTSSVELQSLDPKSASVLCYDVLPHHNHYPGQPSPWDLSRTISERISMHHHVPELGLVILGSLAGRVALLSLTRPPARHTFSFRRAGSPPTTTPRARGRPSAGDGIRVRRAFRVEAVLPRKRDEDRHLRPWCTLHGIAVSPVPDRRADGPGLLALPDARAWRPRAWRLILHYIDHTILMYNIARQEDDGDLLII